jgi:YVTN family beta-propeller protein
MEKLLFCTDTDSGTISVLDLSTNEMGKIAEIAVGNGPRGPVKFTSTGRGFVANHAGDTLSEVDAYSLRETAKISVGVAPIGCAIVPGDRFALTSITGSNAIAVVDLERRKVIHSCVMGREPRHMDITPDGKFAYIAVSGGDYVGKIAIDALTENRTTDIVSSVREIKRIFLGKGAMPYSVSVAPNGKSALAANNQTHFVSIIDIGSDTVRHQVDVGTKGARGSIFSPASDKVFVTLEDSSEILAIDVASGKIEKRMPCGPGPRGIVYDAESNQLFASAFSRTKPGGIREVEIAPNTVSVLRVGDMNTLADPNGDPIAIRDIHVGAGPCSVSIFSR